MRFQGAKWNVQTNPHWVGCRCTQCNKTRDEQHDWSKDCEKCSKCGKIRVEYHVWNGCECSKCRKIRDEQHELINGFCLMCGQGSFYYELDKKVYNTVKIGTQEWMAENLDISHYRNGDSIPQVQDIEEWERLTTGAWCYYNNNEEIKIYGKLYNWFAVIDPRGLAPNGWHVSSDLDWRTLMALYGVGVAVKLKEVGSAEWGRATNETGFTALAGGMRYDYGRFDNCGECGYWWMSNEADEHHGWYRLLQSRDINVFRSHHRKSFGHSVRCVRD